jgi:hypothetical protein
MVWERAEVGRLFGPLSEGGMSTRLVLCPKARFDQAPHRLGTRWQIALSLAPFIDLHELIAGHTQAKPFRSVDGHTLGQRSFDSDSLPDE